MFTILCQFNAIYTFNILLLSELNNYFNTVVLCFTNFSFPLKIFGWVNSSQDTKYKHPDLTNTTVILSLLLQTFARMQQYIMI